MLWPLVLVSSSSRAAMQQCDRFWGGQGGGDVAGALGEGGSELSRADPRKLAISAVTNAPEITKQNSRMLYLGVTAIKHTHSSCRVAFIVCVQRAFLSTWTPLTFHSSSPGLAPTSLLSVDITSVTGGTSHMWNDTYITCMFCVELFHTAQCSQDLAMLQQVSDLRLNDVLLGVDSTLLIHHLWEDISVHECLCALVNVDPRG